MISILLSILIVACSTYIGWGISNYYKKRVIFFKDVNDLLNFLINNINFLKDSINVILLNFVKQQQPSVALIEIINDYISNKKQYYILLKKEEVYIINNIFNHLGKSDSENQIAGLKNFTFQINNVIEKCEADYNKIGRISTKLGFLFGITLAIFFI